MNCTICGSTDFFYGQFLNAPKIDKYKFLTKSSYINYMIEHNYGYMKCKKCHDKEMKEWIKKDHLKEYLTDLNNGKPRPRVWCMKCSNEIVNRGYCSNCFK